MVLMQEGPFDVVVTDMDIVEVTSIDMIADIKAAIPRVKVLAVSNWVDQQNAGCRHLTRKAGADITLQKPFGAGEFMAAVNHCLG